MALLAIEALCTYRGGFCWLWVRGRIIFAHHLVPRGFGPEDACLFAMCCFFTAMGGQLSTSIGSSHHESAFCPFCGNKEKGRPLSDPSSHRASLGCQRCGAQYPAPTKSSKSSTNSHNASSSDHYRRLSTDGSPAKNGGDMELKQPLRRMHILPFKETLPVNAPTTTPSVPTALSSVSTSRLDEKKGAPAQQVMNEQTLLADYIIPYFTAKTGISVQNGDRFQIKEVDFKVVGCDPPQGYARAHTHAHAPLNTHTLPLAHIHATHTEGEGSSLTSCARVLSRCRVVNKDTQFRAFGEHLSALQVTLLHSQLHACTVLQSPPHASSCAKSFFPPVCILCTPPSLIFRLSAQCTRTLHPGFILCAACTDYHETSCPSHPGFTPYRSEGRLKEVQPREAVFRLH